MREQILHCDGPSALLPDSVRWVRCRPADEFPASARLLDERRIEWERRRRVLTRALASAQERRTLTVLGTSCGLVLGIGALEGGLCLADGPSTVDTAVFVFRYSIENLVSSCVWQTRSAEHVAAAVGLDQSMLKTWTTPSDAATLLHVHRLATARSIIGGFTMLTQLLRITDSAARASEDFRAAVAKGTEPPFSRAVQERVIRFCGERSDTTVVTLLGAGLHIMPVFEGSDRRASSGGAHGSALLRLSRGGRVPVHWRIPRELYGHPKAYAGLSIGREWLLRTPHRNANGAQRRTVPVLILEVRILTWRISIFSISVVIHCYSAHRWRRPI